MKTVDEVIKGIQIPQSGTDLGSLIVKVTKSNSQSVTLNIFSNKINQGNFFKRSQATFTPCVPPERTPDFTSATGSEYWIDDNGVTRSSSHWGSVRQCFWSIEAGSNCGYCLFEKFTGIPIKRVLTLPEIKGLSQTEINRRIIEVARG